MKKPQPITRQAIHRVAAHVLGRRRSSLSGHFGLRATPGGIGTPAFGPEPEVVRLAGASLVRERAGEAAVAPLEGVSLRHLARFLDEDIDVPFAVGEATPPVGDPDAPLRLDADSLRAVADCFDLAWRALDEVTAHLPPASRPAAVQLWPEHFDAATHVGVASGERVNLGFSPGDDSYPEPYAYVGPWGAERPGDPAYWNAPFGAVLLLAGLPAGVDPLEACVAWLEEGLGHVGAT